MRKLVFMGILAPLAVITFMNSACGGYSGWPGKGTDSGDAKIVEEVSVSGDPLSQGLWTYYVAYDKTGSHNLMKTVSTYRDATAPFGVFTSDGNLQQHFNDHVGVNVATAYDTNKDGQILFFDDYAINEGFCPTGDPSTSDGFAAYCDKGNWSVLVATDFFEESKQTQPGSKYSNVNPPTDFGPISVGRVLAGASLTPDGSGAALSLTGLSVNGQTLSLPVPATISAYGMGHALAVDASQPSMKQAAAWLADQFSLMPNGAARVSVQFAGGGTLSFKVAAGPDAAAPLRAYATR